MDTEKKQSSRKRGARIVVVVLTVFLMFILATVVTAIILDDRQVTFYMTGGDVTLEYGQEFTEPGIYAVSSGELFGELPRHLPISTVYVGDTGALGTYEIIYRTTSFFTTYSAHRNVTVQDTLPPVITLVHDEGYTPTWYTGYEEEGFTATDNYDGDITDKVVRTEADGRIIYTIRDSAGNTASVERTLDFLTTEPHITLLGDENIVMNACLEFTDPGFTAVDSSGNDMTDYVYVTGEVIPYLAGSYELDYLLESMNGEYVSAVRTVTVLPVETPESVMPDGRVIYLTFDDGPGPYTSALLDVLDRYGAKATFFVTGAYPKYYSMIGRAAEEGHAIGVHTYSHNYREIYASEQAYFDDFNAMQEIIYEQTGSYTRLFRFPGGSSNTVSRFNPGIMSRLAAAMTDLGYCYYDWNVSSGDAGETTKTSVVAQNIIDACANRRVSVVLQHDIKDYSVNAVEKVLVWGINNGYSFRALDLDSPNAHHGIAN